MSFKNNMLIKRQVITVFILGFLVAAGVAAVNSPKQKYKNLKILPQDISDQKLDSIMQSYRTALGVACNFCHVPLATFPDSLDYASDKEPMKENAREMMRMTILLNKTYFYFKKEERPEYLNVVRCMTCHRGEVIPEEEQRVKINPYNKQQSIFKKIMNRNISPNLHENPQQQF